MVTLAFRRAQGALEPHRIPSSLATALAFQPTLDKLSCRTLGHLAMFKPTKVMFPGPPPRHVALHKGRVYLSRPSSAGKSYQYLTFRRSHVVGGNLQIEACGASTASCAMMSTEIIGHCTITSLVVLGRLGTRTGPVVRSSQYRRVQDPRKSPSIADRSRMTISSQHRFSVKTL